MGTSIIHKNANNSWGLLPHVSDLRMCHPKEYGVLGLFGLKKDINSAHYGTKSSMVCKGTTRLFALLTLNEESPVSASTR